MERTDGTGFDAAVERMSRRLQGEHLDACVDAATDIAVILTAADAAKAVEALERLAHATESEDAAQLYVLATELRIERGYWAGFAATLPLAERACGRMAPGEKRDMLEGLLDLARAHSLHEAGALADAIETYERLRANDGYIRHAAETQLGLIALERNDLAAAEEHFARSFQVDEDLFLHLRGYHSTLYDALRVRGIGDDRLKVHVAGRSLTRNGKELGS